MRDDRFERISSSAIPLFVLLLTLFVFGPGQIYLRNSSEFSIHYSEILSKGMVFSVLCFFAVLPFLFLLQKKIRVQRIAVSLIVALCFLLYVQGYLMVWNYGLLDGREIRWQDHRFEAIVDSAVWVVVLALALLKSNWVYPHARTICLLLLAIQGISALDQFRNLPEIPSFKKYTIDESSKFDFSKKQNVIILVLDSFQTDFFQEIINKDGSYKEIFQGFTYFRNSLSGHPFTETSTMNILTGRYYEGDVTFEEHNQNAYRSDSLPAVLKQAGFRVELYPLVKRAIYYDQEILSNITRWSASRQENIENLNQLFDISLFRLLPTVLKRAVYNDQDWLFKNKTDWLFSWLYSKQQAGTPQNNSLHTIPQLRDAARHNKNFRLVSDLADSGTATRTESVFKFYHLGLPHLPLVINEKLEYERMELNRTNFMRQCQAALKLVEFFFQALKRMNSYDDSMIFVIADHGAGAQKQIFLPSAGFPASAGKRIVSQSIMINALPLFLVKPFQSRGPLKTSNAPVSLSDIPATVFTALNVPNHSQGRSVFQISETEKRRRRYLTYKGYNPEKDKYQLVQEWIVTDYGWLLDSWKPGRFYAGSTAKAQPEIYQFGVPIQFGANGNAAPYLKEGWMFDRNFNWILGSYGSLLIPVANARSDMILTSFVGPHKPAAKLATQPVEVYVNGEKIADWEVSLERWYTAWIPKQKSESKMLEITFRLPDQGTQPPPPGMFIRTLSVKESEPYKFGTQIDFHRTGAARDYLVRGWNKSNDQYTWTLGKEAVLKIPVRNAKNDLLLTLDVFPYLGEGKLKHQRVRLKANRRFLEEQRITKAGEFFFVIPKGLIADGFLELLFELPDARSPEELGISEDPSQYALAFRSLRIEEKQDLPE